MFKRPSLVSAPLLLALAPLIALAGTRPGPELTPAPDGPYRVEGNRILDSHGRPYLIRGTSLPPLSSNPADEKSSDDQFGPWSATTLITIRQRINMNAVRIPVDADAYEANSAYRSRVEKLVHLANQFELLVILETTGVTKNTASGDSLFWDHAAAAFREDPNIFFAPLFPRFVSAVRKAGAQQPVIIEGLDEAPAADSGIIYQVTPHYAAIRADSDRQQQFAAASRVPVLVDGLDPELGQSSPECKAFPSDPEEATALVQANLDYFDARQISWTLSSFTAGKLITDYRYYNGTKLDAGWNCEKPDGLPAGLGMVLLSHLWDAAPLGLFTVSESRGGMVIARGGLSTAYGPILADEAVTAKGPELPTILGNVSIRITDSKGVQRLARLLHTGAGWGFISFVIPEECATGPGEVAVVRTDGSVAKSNVIIGDLAPGILTVPPDGRSEGAGQVTQRAKGSPDKSFPTWECEKNVCHGRPIPLSPGVTTTVRLLGTGFRHFGEHPDVKVFVGGISVPVLSVGPSTEPGNDQLTIRLPETLAGLGETDVYFTVNGALSNVVRINIGAGR